MSETMFNPILLYIRVITFSSTTSRTKSKNLQVA